ncbi:hypothetical protein SAMN04488056_106102 [Cohaesibacter marisflavi]|uniref:Uncharacterized protein n=1 Tax=Cohaesibacter marisflavi TaxID=655353 RepID=A0A1I5H9B8_9HYPH|nr:hypothetical protein [Cohaesibacter marisflavi]SFO44797.1 hypothetical protein SAMN04488056_106102 [Cohaesibacter marisflavi]
MDFGSYQRAQCRGDISPALIHLTRNCDQLKSILQSWQIKASISDWVTRYDPAGATSFYDVPPCFWLQLVATNPNGRTGFGIAVAKDDLWERGGRPAIYTDIGDAQIWPESERFRIVYTKLGRLHQKIDWMHEREWRVRGPLNLDNSKYWWVPCVPTYADALELFKLFNWGMMGISMVLQCIYVLEQGHVVSRPPIPQLPMVISST